MEVSAEMAKNRGTCVIFYLKSIRPKIAKIGIMAYYLCRQRVGQIGSWD